MYQIRIEPWDWRRSRWKLSIVCQATSPAEAWKKVKFELRASVYSWHTDPEKIPYLTPSPEEFLPHLELSETLWVWAEAEDHPYTGKASIKRLT